MPFGLGDGQASTNPQSSLQSSYTQWIAGLLGLLDSQEKSQSKVLEYRVILHFSATNNMIRVMVHSYYEQYR